VIDNEPVVRVGDDVLPLSEARERAAALLAEFQALAGVIAAVERAQLVGHAAPSELVDEMGIDRETLLIAAEHGELAGARFGGQGHVTALDRAEVAAWLLVREVDDALARES
jgi:hypothetical protein